MFKGKAQHYIIWKKFINIIDLFMCKSLSCIIRHVYYMLIKLILENRQNGNMQIDTSAILFNETAMLKTATHLSLCGHYTM